MGMRAKGFVESHENEVALMKNALSKYIKLLRIQNDPGIYGHPTTGPAPAQGPAPPSTLEVMPTGWPILPTPWRTDYRKEQLELIANEYLSKHYSKFKY